MESTEKLIDTLPSNVSNQLIPMSIQTLYNKFKTKRITFPECQREGKAWSPEKQRKFIDSILRGYQIPVFYFYQYEEAGQDKFDVYDGQQRIEAIMKFLNGELALISTTNFKMQPIRFTKNRIQYFNEPVKYNTPNLIDEAAHKILETNIHYYNLPPLSDGFLTEFLDETFVRLQEGQSLTGVEKRRARTTDPVVKKVKGVAELIDNHKLTNSCFQYVSGRAVSYALAEQSLKLAHELKESNGDNFGNLTTTELKEMYKKDISTSNVSTAEKVIRKMISILNSTDILEKGDSKFKANKFIPFFLTVNKLMESTAKEKENGIREHLLIFLHELDKITQSRKDDENADLKHFDNRMIAYYEASQEKGTDQHKNLKIRSDNLHNFIVTELQKSC